MSLPTNTSRYLIETVKNRLKSLNGAITEKREDVLQAKLNLDYFEKTLCELETEVFALAQWLQENDEAPEKVKVPEETLDRVTAKG